jgi:hypothetical protein
MKQRAERSVNSGLISHPAPGAAFETLSEIRHGAHVFGVICAAETTQNAGARPPRALARDWQSRSRLNRRRQACWGAHLAGSVRGR